MKFQKIIYSTFAVIFILSAQIVLQAQSKKMSAAVIAKAKTTLVSRIEKGLPRQAFAVWFQKLVGRKTPITWEINDCGEQTGTPEDRGRDFPMCVEATAKTSADFYISVNIQYGTFKRGITRGKPVVRFIYCGDEVRQNGVDLNTLKELSQRADQLMLTAEFYDWNIGIFSLPANEEPSPGFEHFEGMWIETQEIGIKDGEIQTKLLKPHGEIIFGQTRFALRKILFDGKSWKFETVRIEDVSYQFEGKFAPVKLNENGLQIWKDILHGHLKKIVNGKQTAEVDLVLSFYMEGE